ncbi:MULTISPECIES: hypothetical protein [unclassified Nitratiruptor]|uniref:hypothetical protein n=1 Tax=unclassified Nitratiruptor TaxID=2624044 RepID=UPI00191602E0|nr:MULTISPECIES: hypothetical protein [unclassified Nitratiruptor]BCD60413.1 hypothetical protein NitYY0810_C1178 [Nitratiruptor sp. YY08-10]BCD64098.1 hypothetical protein NitYY0814_C0943 [Nitratiruptor sp. YY08-14]
MGLLFFHLHAATSLAKWDKIPDSLFIGEIFPVTIKFFIPGLTAEDQIPITFENGLNLQVRYAGEPLQIVDGYAVKKIFFKVTGMPAKLPDILFSFEEIQQRLTGLPLQVKQLNAPENFCQVLAKRLEIKEFDSVQYDSTSNLVLMRIVGLYANLEDFKLPFAKLQKIKETNESFPVTDILYYAILPSHFSQLRFSYFDPDTREFKLVSIPIIVKDEIVSTQSDINPTEDKSRYTKIGIFAFLGILFLLYGIWKRGYLWIFIAVIMLGYAGYLLIPAKKVCVKKGSKIYILPTKQSTIFKINRKQNSFFKLNEANGYIKIMLPDKKIGWVRKDDICKN